MSPPFRMSIFNAKQLKHVVSWLLGHTNTFFSWYITFVFIYGVMTVLVLIPCFGPLMFHFFTAFVALSFGGFLWYLAFAMVTVLVCDRYIRSRSKKTKKQQIALGPTGLLSVVLIFVLFIGGYGGIKSGLGIIKNDILHVQKPHDNK
jgi:hypothetical protein